MAHEPEERTVELAGGAIHLLTAGSGQDVLVLHHDIGPLGWTAFHAALARRFRVHAADLPGFGESPRAEWARHPRDLAALMLAAARRRGLRDYLLVGLGFGGWVAAEMAAVAYPEMAGLVLAAPAGIRPDEGFILDQVMEEPIAYVSAGFNDEAVFAAHFPDPRERALKSRLDVCRETVCRLTWKPYMYSLELPQLLREAHLPVTVVWGEADAVIPPGCAAAWARALPDCTVRRIPGAGHFLDLEYPDRLAEIVAERSAVLTAKE